MVLLNVYSFRSCRYMFTCFALIVMIFIIIIRSDVFVEALFVMSTMFAWWFTVECFNLVHENVNGVYMIVMSLTFVCNVFRNCCDGYGFKCVSCGANGAYIVYGFRYGCVVILFQWF